MAAISIFIVFFLIKSPATTGDIHHPSREYTIINELDSNKTINFILTNSIGRSLGSRLPKFTGVYSWNIAEQPFFPHPTNVVQNGLSFNSESPIVLESPKRQRRSVTLLPNQPPRRQSVPTGSVRNFLQATSSRKQIMADDNSWRSQIRQSGMRLNTRRSGLLNRRPESNGHILGPGLRRPLNSFQINKDLENNRRVRNPGSEVMNRESRLRGNFLFGSVRRNRRAQFPELDWSGPVPWPIQGRMQNSWQTQYALFPWWQKRSRTTADTYDQQPDFAETDKQAYTEDTWGMAKSKRGDVDVPDSCISLTKNGDCRFYRCFDRRHTCPLRQNFAYNVASRLCRHTEKYLNFFDYQAKKYIRDVKRCQMEALVPLYTSEVVSCAQIEAVGLDILTGGIVPPFVNDVSCFCQNMTFCDVMKDPQNVQLMYDIYGGNGYTEYRVFIHFVKLIQRCPFVARETFNERYARKFTTFDD